MTTDKPLPDVIRYGLEWTGQKDFVCKPMPDGYWTPWHIASAHIAALEAEVKRLREALMWVRHSINAHCFDKAKSTIEAALAKTDGKAGE